MAPPTRLLTPAFARLWVASFLVFLSFYLLLPVLPVYAARLGLREAAIGFVIGVFALASMILKPWAGWAMDWRGRRGILLAGAGLFTLANACYPATGSAASLLLVRIVHGAGMGLFPTAAVAMVADLAPAPRRGEAMGLFGMAANLALAIGPALAGPGETRLGFVGLCGLATALAALGAGLALGVRETAPAAARIPLRLRELFARATLRPALLTLVLFLPYGAVMGFLPLLALERGAEQPGLFFTLMAVTVLLVRTSAGRLSDRFGRGAVVAPALGMIAASLAVVAIARAPWALYAAGSLFGLGLGGAQPTLMAWATDLVPATDRGKAMATFYTAWELGIGGGQIVFGLLLPTLGFEALFAGEAALALVAAALAARRFPPMARS
jgi:MFS family permease